MDAEAAALKATSYTQQDLGSLPVDWEAKPELHWEQVQRAAGLELRGDEVTCGQLSSDWNGHLRGAAVLSGMQQQEQGGWFIVLESIEAPQQAQKGPYQIRRRSLHRDGELYAYEFAMADPATGQIYPASPRVRCRLGQRAECRTLFQEQARA